MELFTNKMDICNLFKKIYKDDEEFKSYNNEEDTIYLSQTTL